MSSKAQIMSRLQESVLLIFWYVYLAFLLAVSFLRGPFDGDAWLIFSAFFYAYTAAYTCFCFFSGRVSHRALLKNKAAILLLFLGLLWLLSPLLLTRGTSLSNALYSNILLPGWFDSTNLHSVHALQTKRLLLSNLMVFTLFVLSLSLINHRRRVKELVFVFFIVGVIHGLIALIAKYSDVHLVDVTSLDGHFTAARGWFVNRNHFAAFISLCFFSVIAVQLKLILTNYKNSIPKLLFKQFFSLSFAVCAFFVVCLLLSQSRAGILAVSVSCLCCLALLAANKVVRLSVIYVLVCIVLLAAMLSVFFGDGLFDRFIDSGLSLGERDTQWAITWQAIKQEFWLGYGGGSYELVFQVFRKDADLRLVIYDQAHNDYLHLFLEQGVIGLALWVGFIVCFVIRAVKHYRCSQSTLESSILLAGLIVITAGLLQSLVGYQLQIMAIRCYFFVIIALVLAVPYVKHQR